MAEAFLHPHNPLTEARPIPNGARTAVFMSWDKLEDQLRRAGVVRPSESVASFVVGSDGVSLVLQRNT